MKQKIIIMAVVLILSAILTPLVATAMTFNDVTPIILLYDAGNNHIITADKYCFPNGDCIVNNDILYINMLFDGDEQFLDDFTTSNEFGYFMGDFER